MLALIEAARGRAYRAVNTELVTLYWQIGEYISKKLETAAWGDGVVVELAAEIARESPAYGYMRRNLFRMRQFFEAYRGVKKVSPLVTQLPWTQHLIILSQTKHQQEREFYLLAAIKERWSKRELERQIATGASLRGDTRTKKVSPAVSQVHPAAIDEMKNSYSLEFLSLPSDHDEDDLHVALLRNLGRFITELGRDFCFVGSEYPVQVGNQTMTSRFRPDRAFRVSATYCRMSVGGDVVSGQLRRVLTVVVPTPCCSKRECDDGDGRSLSWCDRGGERVS